MNTPITPEKTIYSVRKWVAKFLHVDLDDDGALDIWLEFVKDFMGGRN